MTVQHDVSLQSYNTFGINAKAKSFCNITSVKSLQNLLSENHNKPIFVLGGGSNMLLTKNIEALVVHINIKGIKVTEETDDYVVVKAMAGENWHKLVLWCIKHNYGGIENLSLIPGNVGSAPIQNIGAYGAELKDVFISCEAVCIEDQSIRVFNKDECEFDYRESVFKKSLRGKYIITSVQFKLSKTNHQLNLGYGAIKQQLAQNNITHPTISDVSNAVISIRQSKLPDPKYIGNSGSFFKNPIISSTHFDCLKENFPAIPSYKVSETQIKVPAGWLIEKSGFKGKRFNNYGVHDKQALVLVNYGNAAGEDIYNLAKLIQHTVNRLFNITLEIEVNII
ncbi:UDP-N-acetylmuramate dehydrogenase [Winogradskyella aurantia]|uniref:UDP-N-acetylenolpyruvoylglucosamine reductase n=1 Tax=Winogradskyella aurantia TaxID=1915063 RepID=A0A265UVB4_9FLAO|nr:UDP-N-acetylmuramate dehydrogenase [Winogradskyella aurantia]OZV69152.1 UDP-N-acetylenolpyruvoylglucosamine reductase [Winogradskyella aurantia]